MPAYEHEVFDPPAPVALVTVRSPASGEAVRGVAMLLDSGADVTLLPADATAPLGLVADEGHVYELVGFDESRSVSPSVVADLVFLGRTFSGRFLLMPGACGVMGRNVLNHLALVLDGPRGEWREDGAPPGA